jgi:hypothetical protein
MFSDSGTNDKIKYGKDGLIGIAARTPQYRAWKYWLTLEIGKVGFSDRWLTVTSEFPPQTASGACSYAAWLSGVRDSAEVTSPVSRYPRPWDGHIPLDQTNDHIPAENLKPIENILRGAGIPERQWFTRKRKT